MGLKDLYELLQNAEDNGYPQWKNDPKHVVEEIYEQTGDFYTDLEVSFVQTLHNMRV